MLYIVECSYTDPRSEEEWNEFYSQEKLPALVSVNGFSSSQRFRAVKPGCPAYLALHTVKDADVLSSDDYRRKGGGNFSRWQACITDWHRNLYACEAPAPAVSLDEILLLSAQPISALVTAMGDQAVEMYAAGLERSPERRTAWVLPHESALPLADMPGIYLYQPLTSQLQNPVEHQQTGSQ
ncbi:MAG: sugar transporter [Proteobacteria bacterium]|nr:sugar transporter [Pseudomonadota bacterium]